MNGQHCAILAKGDDDGFVYVGDFTGDGEDDLLVEVEALLETVRVYGRRTQARYDLELAGAYNHPLLADADGDGRKELLNLEGPELAAYHYKEDRTTVAGWPYTRWLPTAAADLDADGVDEIISVFSELLLKDLPFGEDSVPQPPDGLGPDETAIWVAQYARPRGGYLNPATGEVVEFEFPQANYRYNVYLGRPEEVVPFDIDGDGRLDIVMKAAIGSHLLAFDQAGKLIYDEEFGKAALSLGILRADGLDHLVIQTANSLLAFP
ncbi:hypothetical protein JW859_05330 [bacterium]|nr:hypothetical protein [bacterium]